MIRICHPKGPRYKYLPFRSGRGDLDELLRRAVRTEGWAASEDGCTQAEPLGCDWNAMSGGGDEVGEAWTTRCFWI
jgi:hypothetical protein